MQCQQHPHIKVSFKCMSCLKYLCSQCAKSHSNEVHELLTTIELSNCLSLKITEQIAKMDRKLSQLGTLKEYENGEIVIGNCMNQILQFVKNVFDQLKNQYRQISDSCWKQENHATIQQIQKKRSVLEQWRQIILKKPDQAAYFDAEQIYQLNKIQSDEELIDSSQSFLQTNSAPKIMFNQIALRKINESLPKIIYMQTKGKGSPVKKLKKNLSKGSLYNSYQSISKFIEGTNILYEYVLQDPEAETTPILLKTQFREFSAPFRSVSVSSGTGIYLIGGYNKQRKGRKEILFYDRTYTSMRIVCLMKEGRCGHAVYGLEQKIYIFGGKSAKSLQVFKVKEKSSQILTKVQKQIMGASITSINKKLYIFGGTDGVQTIKSIFCYHIQKNKMEELTPSNINIFSLPISPLLQPINQNQILIFGGYFTFSGQSYNNAFLTIYDSRINYFSLYGKGEVIYPILANGHNNLMIQSKIICFADLKKARNRHGPNLPVLFTYNTQDDSMQIDNLGL